MVISALSAGACRPEAALGRLTGMPLYCDIGQSRDHEKDQEEKIVSIIGMISIRAFFMLRRWMRISVFRLDLQLELKRGAEMLHLIHFSFRDTGFINACTIGDTLHHLCCSPAKQLAAFQYQYQWA